MKRIIHSITYMVFLSLLTLINCNEKETETLLPPDFENGVFITNEGNFGEGDGSLSYYDFEENKVYNNVYSLVNEGKALGDVVQSISSNDRMADMIYVVVNNSNKAEALLPNTLKSYYVSDDLLLPRYIAYDVKMYVSEWVGLTEKGRVSILDHTSGETLNTITTDYGSEGLIITDNKLFVSNNFTTTVSVIDLNSESVIETLNVGNAPGLMVEDAEGDIWLVCAGGFDQDFMPLGDGKLIEIDPVSISIKNEIDLGMNVSTKIASSPSKELIYYFSGTSLYSFNTNDMQASDIPLISNDEAVGFYGVGVDGSGMIYVSDSKGFTENGEVFVYDPEGNLINSFGVGRGPNGFLFR